MKFTSVFAAAAVACIVFAETATAQTSPPDSQQQTCQTAWYQSEASRSCSLNYMFSFPPDFCKVSADCVRADGSRQGNVEQTRLQNVPSLRNCDGRLGFNC
ncbi:MULTISPECIES: hypothetical protein [Stenotrophomonas]|uniref:hypothetical protein n=1 Tax=Stenotrophomonas TaxID=40323 RepID=UPI000D53F3D9|nr:MULTISPECIES: hypothetical protein [Stenotrophomonas]AWH48731.1 hypothetical protein C1925_05980 [Stenotrophomonas sp. SAU14A_NAIMI4_5]MBK0012378.1 hypothetical protein [Stenotrophomonas sp. S41]